MESSARRSSIGASEVDLVSIAKALNAAYNAHELEAVMAFYTDDLVAKVGPALAPSGSEFIQGKEQLRSALVQQLPGFHVEAWDYRVSGNTVTFAFEYSADFFRNMGVDSLGGTIEADFEGDKIKSWAVTFSPETRQKLTARLMEG